MTFANFYSKLTEQIKAFCYLGKSDDAQNKILLGDHELIIIQKGKSHQFELNLIKEINFNDRKLLLPLVAGGILAPLSFIGIIENSLDPWLLLIIFFVGLISFYYGWRGITTITIDIFFNEQDFPLHQISQNLRVFVDFINSLLPANKDLKKKESMIYHLALKKSWKKQLKEGYYKPDSLHKQGFIHASSWKQIRATYNRHFSRPNQLLIIVIDPLKVNSEIKYEISSEGDQLYPHIFGPLNQNAISKIETVRLDSEGNLIIR